MASHLINDLVVLLFVAVTAVLANTSPFVWGPNVVYLLEQERPFARSIAFTAGRALALFVAGVTIAGILFATGEGVHSLVRSVQQIADSSTSTTYIVIGIALLIGSVYLARRPAAFFNPDTSPPPLPGARRLWPAFAVGIGVAVPNFLEFVWQTTILGGAIVYANGNWVLAGVFVIAWTAFGTAALWGVMLAKMLMPAKTTVWLEKMKSRVPSVKPWQVSVSVAVVGALILGYGVLKLVPGR